MTNTAVTTEVAKAPSKKSQAIVIFNKMLAERTTGLFGTNKAFRTAVISTFQTELGVTLPSASTMYNSAKKEAEATDPAVGLGRDPKKEKAPSTGKRGRPVGSKNKAKEAAPAETAPAEAVADPVA